VCAVAYVLWLEEVNRQTDIQTQAALFARAMGGEVEIPDRMQIRARFDQLLAEEPAGRPTSRRAVLLEAFGVSGG
jgi:hypothetical protein